MVEKPQGDAPKQVEVTTERVKLTIAVAPDDAQRVIDAFRDGKLAVLGVTDIQILDEPLPADKAAEIQRRWAAESGKSRPPAKRTDSTPDLP